VENQHHRRHYLFEYNPSIILLHDDLRVVINTGGGEREGGGRGGETTAYYLASYRVTTMHLCVHGDENLVMLGNAEGKRPKQHDFLGLAYLTKDMSILQDVVVDLRQVNKNVEDFRFFVFFRTAPADRRVVVRLYRPSLVERRQQQQYTIVVLGTAEPHDGGTDTAARAVALKGVHGPRRTGLHALLWQQPRL
jgi:hypothetical protein